MLKSAGMRGRSSGVAPLKTLGDFWQTEFFEQPRFNDLAENWQTQIGLFA
jgi:hypothetical protein